MAAPYGFTVSVRSDLPDLLKKIGAFGNNRQPAIIADALNHTANQIRIAEYAEMRRVFRDPTPWTMNSLWILPATQANLTGYVYLKDQSAKGTPASIYLMPNIRGGGRDYKRSERLLFRVNAMPGGINSLPGVGAQLDEYGNISRGQIAKMTAQLKANLDRYSNETPHSKAKRKRRGGDRYFALPNGNGRLKPGVYVERGGAIKPFLVFTRKQNYKPIFDFGGVAQKVTNQKFGDNLRIAFEKVLAGLK